MSNEFTVTAASNSVQLSSKRQGSAAYTVFNASGRPITGRAILETVPEKEAHAEWLSVDGESERAFVIGAAEQFTVNVNVPPTAPAGSFTFRLKMVDVANTDEGVTDGPTVTVVVPEPPPPRPKFPIWIIPVIVGVIAVIAVVIFLLTRSSTVTMPNVVGQTEADAEGTLVASDLQIGRLRDEASDDVAAGLVARTEPEADTELEKETPVSVFMSTGPNMPTPTSTLTPTPTVAGNCWPTHSENENSSGPNISAIQYLLHHRGGRNALITIDGVYGPPTTAGVTRFQQNEGLPAKGIVDADTWQALVVQVRRGTGERDVVRAVQYLLVHKYNYNLVVDGDFGPTTDEAVRSFQSANGLTADGIVGPLTWSALVCKS